MYRTPPKEKTVKRMIVLTRGEVSAIVKKHLEAQGVLPTDRGNGATVLPCIADAGASYDGTVGNVAKPAGVKWAWEDWPAMGISWEDTIKE